jgi:aspartyl-tRNA synthetase
MERVHGPDLPLPIERLAYDEAMSRYGTDRPDLRFGMELVDVSDALRDTEFKVFGGTIAGGGVVKGLNAGKRDLPRSALDGLIGRAQELGAKGLVWAFREGDGWRSPTAKFLTEEVRLDLGQRFGLLEGERFVWIVDWPMFEWSAEDKRWDPLHHPFTGPQGDFDPENPGEARAKAYDIVWNGQEMGGGSIRISDTTVQEQVFGVIGIAPEEARERFGFLLDALRYGAPPHGGIAYGIDRLVQRLLGADSIREVIAFPKTASGADPLTGAPAPVDEEQLRELGLALRGRPSGRPAS